MTQDTQPGGDYTALRTDLQALRDARGPVTKAAVDGLLKRHPAQPTTDQGGSYDDVAYDPRNYA